jgi:hypothetical protein
MTMASAFFIRGPVQAHWQESHTDDSAERHAPVGAPASIPASSSTGCRDHDTCWRTTAQDATPMDQDFMQLLAAYRASGGLARTHELVGWLKRHHGIETQKLASWIVTGQIIHVPWQGNTWFPWFQFDGGGDQPHPTVSRLVMSMHREMDAWAIACWFVHPNHKLGGCAPLDCLTQYPAATLMMATRAGGSTPL